MMPAKGAKLRTDAQIDADAVKQLTESYVVDKNGCWIWQGLYFSNGYGRLRKHHPAQSKYSGRAHIASYQLHKGGVDAGLFVCHSCDVKGCMNPEHLWLGTNQENQLDASKKGVFARYWTAERRSEKSALNSGEGNPMYGRSGEAAPCYGRTGSKHPMYGKHHNEASKKKISESLNKTFKQRKSK